MFLAGVLGLRDRVGIAILALLSFAWFTIDRLFETKHVLVAITRTNGLTAPDLVGILGLVITALLTLHWRRSRRTEPLGSDPCASSKS